MISRYYISQILKNYRDPRPRISHLIMLGTPNMGSPCADVMNVAFEALGKNVEAVRQLRQDYAEGFNRVNTQRKGVKFSALAGNPLPTMCKQVVWNDGVVSVPSAKWIIKDTAESKNVHTDLTGTSDFSNFVKPRLAIGPKGDHNPEMPEIPTRAQNQSGAYFMNASYKSEPSAVADGLNINNPSAKKNLSVATNISDIQFAKAVKISPKQAVEIEIPIENALNFGLTFWLIRKFRQRFSTKTARLSAKI